MQINSTILASLWLRSYMLKIHNIYALLSVEHCGVGTKLNFLSPQELNNSEIEEGIKEMDIKISALLFTMLDWRIHFKHITPWAS